jgi:hypothetical protein
MELSFAQVLALPFAEARAALLDDKGCGARRSKKESQSKKKKPTSGLKDAAVRDDSCSLARVREGLGEDGFHVLRLGQGAGQEQGAGAEWAQDVCEAAETVRGLERRGFPASFLLLSEAAWSMARAATALVRSTVSEDLVCNMVSAI